MKTIAGFDVPSSSIPQATVDHLSSLEWLRAQHNLAIIGPSVISMARHARIDVRDEEVDQGFVNVAGPSASVAHEPRSLRPGVAAEQVPAASRYSLG
jgi:hypothetical protein